jgi:hypothetical protein
MTKNEITSMKREMYDIEALLSVWDAPEEIARRAARSAEDPTTAARLARAEERTAADRTRLSEIKLALAAKS